MATGAAQGLLCRHGLLTDQHLAHRSEKTRKLKELQEELSTLDGDIQQVLAELWRYMTPTDPQ